jgi:hypothetical protein
MTRVARIHLSIVSLLVFVLLSLATTPAVSAGPRRVDSAERLAHKLVNCLRTGGKVTTAGTCKGYGSGKYSKKRPPLKRSKKISDKVSYPWAVRTAKAGICGHTLSGSTVDKRFRSVGLKHIDNGENIGCSTAWSAKKMVITMLRWWYAEKSYGGWHWKQLKAWKFKSAGYGVTKLSNGRSRLVVNFYGKVIP